MNDPTLTIIAAAVAVAIVFFLLNLKSSRPDGELIRNLHTYRTMMFYIMPTRNESVVYFDEYVDAEKLLQYTEEATQKMETNVSITHAVVAASAIGFAENPAMDRFVNGYRLYQRYDNWISFSMKRERLNKKAKLAVIKQKIADHHTFRTLCEEINAGINVQRSGKKTYADKEYDLFTAIPRPALHRLTNLVRQLNYWNLLPASFIEPDPMHCSLFVANLGSVKMGAGYHHLYEWGTCPLFLMVGQIEDKPVVRDGKVVVRPILHLRFSYDERIDDGLTAGGGIQTVKECLEDPYGTLGCLADDGSDAWSLTTPRPDREAA